MEIEENKRYSFRKSKTKKKYPGSVQVLKEPLVSSLYLFCQNVNLFFRTDLNDIQIKVIYNSKILKELARCLQIKPRR